MSYNNRPLSPGGKRLVNPGRISDQTLTDPAYQPYRHSSYTPVYSAPRTSGVIPISSQTFVAVPPPRSAQPANTTDSYSGRPRRGSFAESQRPSASSSHLPARSKPTIVQQDARPMSPAKTTRDEKYYVTPAASHEPRSSHKKLYSVDDTGAKLVADVNVSAGGERHHRRRDSADRTAITKERDRGRRSYHPSIAQPRTRDKSIDDDDAYSYTDAAGMFRDTQPSWREGRARRGSVDRGNGVSRERPVSMLDPNYDPRKSVKDVGPPPSTRGWSKIQDNVGRTRSVREISASPNRARGHTDAGAYADSRDQYYAPPPRTHSSDRRATVHQNDGYDPRDLDREPRRHERRNSVTRTTNERPDQSVERRGFGIRPDFRNETRDPFPPRGSNESFEQSKYRDSGFAETNRRDAMPEPSYQDERERIPQREIRDKVPRRNDDRSYERDYERPRDRVYDREYERDKERERERARQLEPPSERHHSRRDTADRDREYSSRKEKENSPRRGGDSHKPSLAQAATGGLAGAAAAFGLSNLIKKNKGEKDDGKDRNDRNERVDRQDRGDRVEPKDWNERNDRHDSYQEEDCEPVRERRPGQAGSHSDEPYFDREQDRYREKERGLGFAFEAPPPEQSRTAPPPVAPEYAPVPEREREVPRSAVNDFAEREHEGKTVEMPKLPIDPEEDYRRRMEQVQRELGQAPDEGRNSDSDPDRERRRRDREQRQRERDLRNGTGPAPAFEFNEAPPPAALRRSFEDDQMSASGTVSSVDAAGPSLRKRRSILDMPMMEEPMAQIIDNTESDRRENRVRIVDPPTFEEEERRPKGILKRPTQKFPEDRNSIREGVAPLKDATKKGIPPGARWTKIDRRLVNPEALEAAQERFEERLDCVIVLRVLTKEEIQKLADRTTKLRDQRYEEDRAERKAAKRREREGRDRRGGENDEYINDNSEDEFKAKAPKMLEAPASMAGSAPSEADFVGSRDRSRRERDRGPVESEAGYGMGSSGTGRGEMPGRWE